MSDRDLTTSRTRVFGPQPAKGTHCRVCERDVDDGRACYCSDYCREIATAVMNLLNWSSVRRRIKERDGHTCENCGSGRRLEVDHIVPVSDGGHPFDPANLRTLCEECHQEKTAAEAAGRSGRRPGDELDLLTFTGG